MCAAEPLSSRQINPPMTLAKRMHNIYDHVTFQQFMQRGFLMTLCSMHHTQGLELFLFLKLTVNGLILLFRFILLRKPPTILKLICAIIVFIGLIFSLIPTISGLDKGAAEDKEQYMQQPELNRILWPLIFMFGFVSTVCGS